MKPSTLVAAALALSSVVGLAYGCGTSNASSRNCESAPCGSGAVSNICTTLDSDHVCVGITYEVGGQSFACASCLNCAQAQTQVAQVCGATAADDAGSDIDAGGDEVPRSDAGCGAASTCGTTGVTYEECVATNAAGACQSIVYKTSDGHDFACSPCTDCSSAATELANYCAGLASPVTTCGASQPCGGLGLTEQQCTTTTGGSCTSVHYEVSNGTGFACASCNDCSGAAGSLAGYCASLERDGCAPNCAGLTCGASDGCGGICTSGSCASGQECAKGVCQCDATSCPNGCCSSGQCEQGTSTTACGASGEACVACNGDETCNDGACAAANDGGASDSGLPPGWVCMQTPTAPPPYSDCSEACAAQGKTCGLTCSVDGRAIAGFSDSNCMQANIVVGSCTTTFASMWYAGLDSVACCCP